MSGKIILQMFLLIIAGLALGALNKTVNPNSPKWVGHYIEVSDTDTAKIPEAAEPDDPPYISVGEALDFFNRSDVLFVDARDEWDYQQGHIAGAVNVPFEGEPAFLDTFMAQTDSEQTMIVYCNGAECDLSLYLGRTLAAEGFTGVNIFFGGWTDWNLQELPVDVPAETSEAESEG